MKSEQRMWDDERFQQNPFKVPEGYFEKFPDRMMDLIHQEGIVPEVGRSRILRPWMAWVSGIAAVLVLGWFGFSNLYLKPVKEMRIQENIALLVDYYGEELHEGQLAGYLEENQIEVNIQSTTDLDDVVLIESGLAEEYIFESVVN